MTEVKTAVNIPRLNVTIRNNYDMEAKISVTGLLVELDT